MLDVGGLASRRHVLQDLERKLADAVAAYIATTDETARSDAERRLCAVLEYLSGERLKAENSWSQHAWVDGVLAHSVEPIDRRGLVVRGRLIWVDGNQWWLEPFEATVELGADHRLTYDLRIGDAARGLRATPYGSTQQREFVVTDWIFRLKRE